MQGLFLAQSLQLVKTGQGSSLVFRHTKNLKCSLSLFWFGAVVQNDARCTQGVLMLGLVGESVQRLKSLPDALALPKVLYWNKQGFFFFIRDYY